MRAGAVVALVSDAGMPLISDPGFALVRACIEAGLPVEVLPGPSAVLDRARRLRPAGRALALRRVPPAQAPPSAERLLEHAEETLVAFESPRRLAATLAQLAGLDPDRPLAVCRELTKLHEEVRRGTAAELAEHYARAARRAARWCSWSAPPRDRVPPDRPGISARGRARGAAGTGRRRRSRAAGREGRGEADGRERERALPAADGRAAARGRLGVYGGARRASGACDPCGRSARCRCTRGRRSTSRCPAADVLGPPRPARSAADLAAVLLVDQTVALGHLRSLLPAIAESSAHRLPHRRGPDRASARAPVA